MTRRCTMVEANKKQREVKGKNLFSGPEEQQIMIEGEEVLQETKGEGSRRTTRERKKEEKIWREEKEGRGEGRTKVGLILYFPVI